MSKEKLYYYEVAVALSATWKQHIYIYHAQEKTPTGSVVVVPFGKTEKTGYILSESVKPTYLTKPLMRISTLAIPQNTRKFIDWMISYYPGSPGSHVQHFVPGFLKNLSVHKLKKPVKTVATKKHTVLTDDQTAAYELLTGRSAITSSVLHGITGSGKTRLYCELAQKIIAEGKNVLILYPEISLTSQLEQTLIAFFGGDTISVYHSRRTPSEQKQAWLKAHNTTRPIITIGPRSALFLPYKNLGLVIIDEAHDGAYKQDSGTRYSGLIAAGALSRQHGAQLIMGSATPPVSETQHVLAKGGSLVCMHKLAVSSNTTTKSFEIVDMRKPNNHSSSYLISKPLMEDIRNTLKNNKQSLLFINKRGTARMLLCENCGWHAECPNCELPLTHHHDSFSLQCTVCGLTEKSIIACPTCRQQLSMKNPGIKSVEQDLRGIFPDARIARFDSDNKKRDTFSEKYEFIKSGGADIIVGTQLLTKGLDLPLLETVGILQADSALLLPDYTSEERAFQQLTQVSGRVGRGHTSGKVIVQTYQPDSYMFNYVTSQDWHGFYTQELEKRKNSHYPPYLHVMKIWVVKKSRESVIKASNKIAAELKSMHSLRVLGPAPSYYEKVSGNYSWQIIVMSSSRQDLAMQSSKLPADFYFDLDPASLL
jgi:primosomal protein N' (replication factor Y) (superfamily II helicase)